MSIDFGMSEETVAWIRRFADSQSIPKVLFVYAPPFSSISPQGTRMRGYGGWDMETNANEMRC